MITNLLTLELIQYEIYFVFCLLFLFHVVCFDDSNVGVVGLTRVFSLHFAVIEV